MEGLLSNKTFGTYKVNLIYNQADILLSLRYFNTMAYRGKKEPWQAVLAFMAHRRQGLYLA